MRGVTRLNFGLDAFIADALGPYQMLVTRLQTSEQPVAHLVKEWVLLFFDEMNEMFLSESANFGRHYQAWTERGDAPDDDHVGDDEMQLRRDIERIGKKFVHDFVTNVRYRFQPYWPLLMACEMANPCSPKQVSPAAWTAAKDLMMRTGKWTVQEADVTVKNLKTQRRRYARASVAEERRMSGNLLKFYHDRYVLSQQTGEDHDFTLCDEYFRLVASLHVSSSVVESYFSRTKYIKNKHRSLLSDKTVSATMHLREMQPAHVEVLADRNINPYLSHNLCQCTKDDYHNKYVQLDWS